METKCKCFALSTKKKKKNREQKSHAKLFSTGLCTLSKDYELNKFQI